MPIYAYMGIRHIVKPFFRLCHIYTLPLLSLILIIILQPIVVTAYSTTILADIGGSGISQLILTPDNQIIGVYEANGIDPNSITLLYRNGTILAEDVIINSTLKNIAFLNNNTIAYTLDKDLYYMDIYSHDTSYISSISSNYVGLDINTTTGKIAYTKDVIDYSQIFYDYAQITGTSLSKIQLRFNKYTNTIASSIITTYQIKEYSLTGTELLSHTTGYSGYYFDITQNQDYIGRNTTDWYFYNITTHNKSIFRSGDTGTGNYGIRIDSANTRIYTAAQLDGKIYKTCLIDDCSDITYNSPLVAITNDAYTDSANPDTNYGASQELQLSQAKDIYLDLGNIYNSANLHLYNSHNHTSTIDIHATEAFDEDTITYYNKPAKLYLITSKEITSQGWYNISFEYPMTRYITIDSGNSEDNIFASSENTTSGYYSPSGYPWPFLSAAIPYGYSITTDKQHYNQYENVQVTYSADTAVRYVLGKYINNILTIEYDYYGNFFEPNHALSSGTHSFLTPIYGQPETFPAYCNNLCWNMYNGSYAALLYTESSQSYVAKYNFTVGNTILPPIPTPIPTPSTTPTAEPTYPTIPDPQNYTQFNGTGFNDTADYINSSMESALTNINNGTILFTEQFNSYNYSTSKSIYSFFLPAIFNMLPAKLWTLIIFGWTLTFILFILKR